MTGHFERIASPAVAGDARARGRSAQKFGKQFERDIEAACDAMRLAGYGLVVKTNPPVVLKRGPDGALGMRGFAGTGGADFMGALRFDLSTPRTFPVFLDAKSRGDEATFRVLDDRADARETARRQRQARFLFDARLYTPFAGYVVWLRKLSTVVLVNDPSDLSALARGESVPLRVPREVNAGAIYTRFARVSWGDAVPAGRAGARQFPGLPLGFFPLLSLLFAVHDHGR